MSRPIAAHNQALIGTKFGKLLILSLSVRNKKDTYANCECECNNTKSILLKDLKNGKTKSCGCLYPKKINNTIRKKPIKSKYNTLYENKEMYYTYQSWICMKARCYNPNTENFSTYGGRGITVCDRWLNSFDNFVKDMGIRPDKYTLDRIDNNQNYTPENCRWADMKTQARNRQDTRFIEYEGKRITIAELADLIQIDYGCLYQRLVSQKWSIEKAINEPIRQSKPRQSKST